MKQTPTVITLLAVGCKRRVIIYSWKDGQPQRPAKVSNDIGTWEWVLTI